MKERPILFSGPMVRALLAGTKTQTRRVAVVSRLDLQEHDGGMVTWGIHFSKHQRGILSSHSGAKVTLAQAHNILASQFCPYGKPGDRILVRETFYAWGHWETRFSAKKGRDEWHFVDMTVDGPGRYFYAADGAHPASDRRASSVMGWWKRPAIFMPKAASRILLEVTEVRVERLQSISEADAASEGLIYNTDYMGHWSGTGECWYSTAREAFRDLWKSINGAGSWDANQFVWAVSFRVIKGGQP